VGKEQIDPNFIAVLREEPKRGPSFDRTRTDQGQSLTFPSKKEIPAISN
jgi:hypothetical protein